MEVKTVIPSSHARIMLVGESPGEIEEACGIPFVGSDGTTLKKILTQAGIFYGECIIANISTKRLKTFYLDKARQHPTPEFAAGIARLKSEIETLKPNLIVALGAIPMYVLTGNSGIDSFRGSICPGTLVENTKVLITQHPKAVHFNWQLFYIMIMDFRKAAFESFSPDLKPDTRKLVVAPNIREIITYLTWVYENRATLKIAIDLEHVTPGAHISWFGISHSTDYAMSIQFIQNRIPCFNENDEVEIWSWISKICSSGIPIIFHNGSYDAINLWHNQGIWCTNIEFDTIIAAHTLWPELPRKLGFVASILLNVPAWKHTSGNQYEHGEYNAADTCNTRALYDKLKSLIYADPNYTSTFENEMSQLELAGYMQLQGLHVNTEERDRLRIEFQTKKDEIEAGLSVILKKPVNFSSPKQMQELLYVDMGLPVQYKRRKSADDPKKITTDAEALEKLFIQTQHPVLKLLIEHRKYTKILQFINVELSTENKVHTSYNITGTDTGRWSSSESIILTYGSGNLQNIDKRIRSMYVPPPGKCFIQADYIGAEAHLVANVILDQKLMQAFDNGEDVHIMTAAFMFNVKPEDVTKEQRTIGKSIRHATNYSGGPAVVQKKLQIPLREAKSYLSRFTSITPQLAVWHGKLREKLQEDRTLITPLGRKRIFMDRWGDQLFRSAYAFIPQSTIGDLLNISFVDFYNKHKSDPDMSCALQLHDAIYISCNDTPEDRSFWAKQLYLSMHRPISLQHRDLYIGVDFKWGYDWKNMEELELSL